MATKRLTAKDAAKQVKKIKEYVLQPDYDTVIVDELTMERVSSGGIIIPEVVDAQDEEDIKSGYIVAIGPNSNPNRPFLFKKGDLISFGHYNGRRINLNGKQYIILRHLDVLVKSTTIE